MYYNCDYECNCKGTMCIGAKKKIGASSFENSNLNWLVMGTSGWCWYGGLEIAGSSPAAGSKVPNRLIV
jgi:hypothetical protein